MLKFPEYFDSYNVETKILNEFNSLLSKSPILTQICFDLSRTKWIDLFGLSILVHLLDSAAQVTQNIQLLLPSTYSLDDDPVIVGLNTIENIPVYKKRKDVCAFLDRWGFIKYLLNISFIKSDYEKQTYDFWSKSNEENISHVLELKFIRNYNELYDIRSMLNDEEKITEMFSSYSSLNLLKNGEFANILIWELGRNIIDHSKSQIGLLTIHIVKDFFDDENKEIRNKNRINYAPAWEKKYYINNYSAGYVEIILSDNGIGIYESLKEDYAIKLDVSQDNVKEVDVLEWAFLEYSSRNKKDIEEEPRTGLFWVRECIQAVNGFISVRVGKSVIAYDFSGKKNLYEPFKTGNLEHLQGTHIKILIPLKEELSTSYVSKSTYHKIKDFKNLGVSKNKQYLIYDNEKELEKKDINLIINEIDKSRIGMLPFVNNLFIDFKFLLLDKNSLNKLFMKFYSIGQSTTIIIYNFNKVLVPVLETTKAYELMISTKTVLPILLVDNSIYWLGLNRSSDALTSLFRLLLYNKSIDLNDIEKELKLNLDIELELKAEFLSIIKRNSQLIHVKKPYNYDSYELSFSYESINYFMAISTQLRLENALYSTNALQKGKFYFPAGNYYSEFFIEARRLVEEPAIEKQIISELKRLLLQNQVKYDMILSCTPTGRELAALLYESTGGLDYTYFKEYFFNDTDIPSKRIKEGDRILILTDVVGNGSLIDRLIRYVKINQAKPVAICSIINTSENYYKINDIPLFNLLDFPIIKITTKPVDWNEKEIQRINPNTISPEPIEEDNLSKDIQNYSIFWRIIEESQSVYGEHIRVGDRCYQYYIDTEKIFKNKNYRDIIINDLSNSIDCEKINILFYPVESNITYITDYVKEYITSISSQKTKAIPAYKDKSSLFNEKYYLSKTYKNDFSKNNILIIDDSINTSSTLDDLIEICESFEVNSVSIYVFINRLHPNKQKEFLQRIKSSNVKITFSYFYELDLTVYMQNQCPYCNELNNMALQRQKFRSTFANRQFNSIAIESSPNNTNKMVYLSESYLLAKIKEQVNRVGIKEAIVLLNAEREPNRIQSYFDSICEIDIYIHSLYEDKTVINYCEEIITGKVNYHEKSKYLAIKYLEKNEDTKLIELFSPLFFSLTNNEILYWYILTSFSKILLNNENLKIRFEEIFNEIQKEVKHPLASKRKEYVERNRQIRRYIYYFKQDFSLYLSFNEEEQFYSYVLKVFSLIRPFKNNHHVALHQLLNLINSLLFRQIENVGGDNNKYELLLKQKAETFKSLREDLMIIQYVGDIIHDLKDIKISNYFLQSSSPNMLSDIYTLEFGMQEIIANKMNETNQREIFISLRSAIDRLLIEIFRSNDSLKEKIKEYSTKIGEVFKEVLITYENPLSANLVETKIIINDADDHFVLFDRSNLNMLFTNLINDSIKYGFKEKKSIVANEIIICIYEKDNSIYLEYSDNGLGDTNDSFMSSYDSNDKTWGEFRRLFERYGVMKCSSNNKGTGFSIKLKFIRGEYEK